MVFRSQPIRHHYRPWPLQIVAGKSSSHSVLLHITRIRHLVRNHSISIWLDLSGRLLRGCALRHWRETSRHSRTAASFLWVSHDRNLLHFASSAIWEVFSDWLTIIPRRGCIFGGEKSRSHTASLTLRDAQQSCMEEEASCLDRVETGVKRGKSGNCCNRSFV